MIMYTREMIVALRKKLGLSVIQFAEKLGVDRQSVYDWQNGKCHPRFETLEKMNELASEAGIRMVRAG